MSGGRTSASNRIMRYRLTGACRFFLAVGGGHRAATDGNVPSVRTGSAADAAGGMREERPPRRVCKHPTGEWAGVIST
jgi:hypothetical protein